MANQPKLLVARSRAERIMQVAAISALVTLIAYAARVWPELPATVPTHFGITGTPDAWGGRSSLLVLPTIATAFFVGLTLIERVPHTYNYGIEVTAANAPQVYALARRLMLSLKLIFVVAFGFIFRVSVEVALGNATALPVWFLPAVVGTTAGVVLVTIVRISRTRAQQRG